jgi:hypothetical protein
VSLESEKYLRVVSYSHFTNLLLLTLMLAVLWMVILAGDCQSVINLVPLFCLLAGKKRL